jgi:glycyl-tRNA synthetase beta chain
MSELFIELLSEEIPYWLQKNIVEQFKEKITDVIIENNLSLKNKVSIDSNFTQLRLIFSCSNLIKEQKTSIKEIKGPPVNAPENAIEGFLKKVGVSKKNLEKKKINDQDYYFAKYEEIGKKSEEVIKNNLENIITTINWPKSMRWIHDNFKWGRPINNILFYFDNKFIPLDFLETYSINNNSFTISHKKNEKEIKFKSFNEYKKKLISSKVIIEQSKREEKIKKEIDNFCKQKKVILKDKHIFLVSLNAGLTEYPDVLFGKIQKDYMSLPQEILEVVMINDQNFMPLFEKNNNLSPYFVIVGDLIEKKFQKEIVQDNEKVLEARFADAVFYWENDLKIKLESRKQLLSDIQFHQKLGTFDDKTKRMEFFAMNLATQLNFQFNTSHLTQAVKLSKLDLTTGLVREFPELEGIIGGYIAEVEKKDKDVCLSLKEQYLPKGPSDLCPKNNLSILLSLSDKLDTLLGFFLIDEMPTSSKDPYALRRSALGILRIIIENNLKIELEKFFNDDVINKYNLQNTKNFEIKNLIFFLINRFKFFLKAITKRQDVVNAFFIEKFFSSDFLTLYKKFLALNNFINKGEGKKIIELNKRALNIVTIEGKKIEINNFIDKDLLKEQHEKILVDSLNKVKNKIENEEEDFNSVLNTISNLHTPLNNFFDNVMVNVDDVKIKSNRLSILKKVLDTIKVYADFSKIQK